MSLDSKCSLRSQRARWHLHTLVCTATVPFFMKLKVTGWTIHLRGIPLDDYPIVLHYIHKDRNLDIKKQDIISQNYYLSIDYANNERVRQLET